MLVLATGGTARTLIIGVPFWLVTIFLGFLLWPVFKYFPTVELVGLVALVPLTFAFLWERRPRLAAVAAAAERNRRGASAAWATCFDQVAW